MAERLRQARCATSRREVHDVLAALGGEGTLGDIVAISGIPQDAVSRALDSMLADDTGHVRVSLSGDVVYHLSEEGASGSPWAGGTAAAQSRTRGFDRRTLRLIRAREGVLSVAELVEHTGLTVADAHGEMQRIAARFGGSPCRSLDEHVVYVFPELMTSAHGRFGAREPRPAWVLTEDPMRGRRGGVLARLLRRVWARLRGPPGLHLRDQATVRRLLLGLVVETALAGKGVVSLARAVAYCSARARVGRVRRRVVERALRALAVEFDAPITECGGDLFFGFRNVKRQFLASLLVRRQTKLSRTAWGPTIFDTADAPLVATERDLVAFDSALRDDSLRLALPGAT